MVTILGHKIIVIWSSLIMHKLTIINALNILNLITYFLSLKGPNRSKFTIKTMVQMLMSGRK